MQSRQKKQELRLAMCKRNSDGVVLSQNQECLRICKNRRDLVCRDGCNAFLDPHEQRQMQIHENVVVHGVRCNVVTLDVGGRRFTAIESHEAHYRDFFSGLSGTALTETELRVMKMKIAGFTNRQIADENFVSISAVKTHLLHAYRKITPKRVAELVKKKTRKKA